MSYKQEVPKPCKSEVEYYLKLWDSLQDYTDQEKALNKLFFGEEFKSNKDIQNILIKCSTLNDFYSTNIFKVYPVAKHILDLDIDDELHEGKEELVEKIANIDINGKDGKLSHKCFYSFASKYCSHHNPEAFPIYDSYVDKILRHFRKHNERLEFHNNDLKSYSSFKNVLRQFQELYGITEYSLKDLDRYLWQLGKRYYPNDYSNN